MDRSQGIETRRFVIAWFVCLVFLELLGGSFAHSKINTLYDFRSFYAAGHLLRTHPSAIYNLQQQGDFQLADTGRQGFLPFYHPAYEALLFAPFTLLNYQSAYLVFVGCNMLLLLAAFFAGRPLFSQVTSRWRRYPELMFFLFIPVLIAIVVAQDSILSLLLYAIVWKRLEARKDMSAGCILALGLFKFQIAIPIAVLIVIRRGRRFAGGFLGSAAALALVSAGLIGRAGIHNFISNLTGASSAIDKSAAAMQRMGVYPLAMPNITGLVYAFGGHDLRSPTAFDLCVGICSLAIFLWCCFLIRRCDTSAAFSIGILCSLMVSYHLFSYDLTLLLIPIALLAKRTPGWIFLALFIIPIVLFPFGTNAFYLTAIPILAMLIHALITACRKSALPRPEAPPRLPESGTLPASLQTL